MIRSEIQSYDKSKEHRTVISDLVRRINSRLARAGFIDQNKTGWYVSLMAAPVLLIAMLALISDKPVWLVAALCLLTVSVENMLLDKIIKRRKAKFDTALYKIYRFIDMQLKAGLNLSSIIGCLPEALNDKTIQPSLQRMAAAYRLSGDLTRSVQELESSFAGHEAVLLGNHLRQCMLTGVAGTSFTRMESLLFTRHLSLIKANSDKLRMEMLVAVILASVPVLVIVLYPLFLEFTGAYQSLFS